MNPLTPSNMSTPYDDLPREELVAKLTEAVTCYEVARKMVAAKDEALHQMLDTKLGPAQKQYIQKEALALTPADMAGMVLWSKEDHDKCRADCYQNSVLVADLRATVARLEAELAEAKADLASTVTNEEFCSEWISRIATIVGVHPDRLLFMEETESAIRLYKDALTAAESEAASLREENGRLRTALERIVESGGNGGYRVARKALAPAAPANGGAKL